MLEICEIEEMKTDSVFFSNLIVDTWTLLILILNWWMGNNRPGRG